MARKQQKNTHLVLAVVAILVITQILVFGNFYVVRLKGKSMGKRVEEHVHFPEHVQPSAPIVQPKHRPAFLWGIPCVLEDFDKRRTVRETYLRYYKDEQQDQNDRICSLLDLQQGRVRLEDCQVAYFFFIGGNPNGPTELCELNASMPILAPERPPDLENDVVALNIRENMEDGKSQTFLKYASLVIENEFHFDYVVKVDSDALVFIPTFLNFLEQQLRPLQPVRIYGGLPQYPKKGQRFNLTGGLYMSGSLYWMSADLASYVSSEKVDRKAITNFIPVEDVDIGNFVFSHPWNITTVEVKRERFIIHPYYDMNWYRHDRIKLLKTAFYAHSESDQTGQTPRPYFKDQRQFRKYWSIFQAVSASNRPRWSLYALYEPTVRKPEEPFVRLNDYIYSDQDYDSSPIVLESHKLVFFTVSQVGDVTWRCLFRRMMGYDDWQNTDSSLDGLRYLRDCNQTEASRIMTSPDYTRAMFVRDPKARLLSIHQNEVSTKAGLSKLRNTCCADTDINDKHCQKEAKSFDSFLRMKFPEFCDEFLWRPQSRKMEPRYFEKLTFVGHYERMQADAKRLLERVGAWDDYGSSGWGENGSETIFSMVPTISEDILKARYSGEGLGELFHSFYKEDYAPATRSLFNLSTKVAK